MGEVLRRAAPIYESAHGTDEVRRTADCPAHARHPLTTSSRSTKTRTPHPLQRALTIGEHAHGGDSIRIAPTRCRRSGDCAGRQEISTRVIAIYTRTLAIKEAHLGPDHPYLGLDTVRPGGLNQPRPRGALSDARAYYDRVIALQTRTSRPG